MQAPGSLFHSVTMNSNFKIMFVTFGDDQHRNYIKWNAFDQYTFNILGDIFDSAEDIFESVGEFDLP